MIRLRVLGSLELCSDDSGELRSILAQPKRAALLAYLAAALPRGFHRRDRLLALFWPEQDDAHARDALNAAVSFLRRGLGRDVFAKRASDEIAIDDTVIWCDVVAFRAALDDGRFDDALALYRGDFLDGFFADGAAPIQDWIDRTRMQLRAGAARAARAVAERREHEQNFTAAVSCARRAVELSDGDERVLRQLLEMLERLGDRAGAVLAYDAFERRLAAELETEPSAETRALMERIRTRPVAGTRSAEDAPNDGAPVSLRGWRVERELGRGGMATVYLARDAVHDRYVALKVMHPELVLSNGVDAFLREIGITARLAHPHILPLIDSGARDGAPYLVTPYVAGESLRARLSRDHTLPLDDALRLTIEVAEALDYAHRSGVVHRDVKPENILLADGHALVADFGVARALGAAGASRGDDGATVVGSPRYMSPEQAAGSTDVDARTDIYALGCVLFEMLCGQAPGDVASTATQLTKQCGMPVGVRQLVTDCLAHDREQRPVSAAVVVRRIEELKLAERTTPRRTMGRRASTALIASGVGLAAVLLAWSAPQFRRAWSAVEMGPTRQITNTPGLELDPAISPDGKLIAFAAGSPARMRIYVRPTVGGDAIEVSGPSIRQHRWPSWSPDGSRLAFLATQGDRGPDEARIFIVPALGGTRRLIADHLSSFSTPAWSPDGRRIAYAVRDSIAIRDTSGSELTGLSARPRTRTSNALTTGGSMWAIHSLAWSPDGRRLAFVSGNEAYAFAMTAFGNLGPSSVWTIALDGSPPTRVTTGLFTFASPVWTPDSRGLLYASNGNGAWDVYTQALDRDGVPNGKPARLTTGLNAHGISLARDGKQLAYSLMNYRSNVFAAPITRDDGMASTAVVPVTDANQTIETVDVTPDGTWLVFESNRDGRSHIYKMSIATRELVQLTHDSIEDFAPKWSPDGKRIAFHSREPAKDGLRNVYVMDADGGQRTRLSSDSLDDSYPRWLPDGRLVYTSAPNGAMTSTLGADGRWTVPVADTFRGFWSRDGRYRLFRQKAGLFAQRSGGSPQLVLATGALPGQLTANAVGPDPATVYVRTIDSSGVHAFYSVPIAGGKPKLILRLEDSAQRPARVIFSADARRLYFTVTQAESDIWVVDLHKRR